MLCLFLGFGLCCCFLRQGLVMCRLAWLWTCTPPPSGSWVPRLYECNTAPHLKLDFGHTLWTEKSLCWGTSYRVFSGQWLTGVCKWVFCKWISMAFLRIWKSCVSLSCVGLCMWMQLTRGFGSFWSREWVAWHGRWKSNWPSAGAVGAFNRAPFTLVQCWHF